jgi:hypothetical protein
VLSLLLKRVINRSQLERTRVGAILHRSDAASLFERKDGTKVNTSRILFTGQYDSPTDAVREHGT